MIKKPNKYLIPTAIILAGLIIAGYVIFINLKGEKSSPVLAQQIAEKALNYINENLLEGEITASLVEAVKEGELVKMKLEIGGNEFDSYVYGKYLFPDAFDMEEELPVLEEEVEGPVEQIGSTIGNFKVSSDEVCKENDKPIIYFFGSEGCGYCGWEHPIIEEVAAKFEGEISFHNNMDSDADRDIFSKYSTGGIPTLVLGCKYYRVGAGTQSGEEKESQYLTALICKLTGNQPAETCAEVQDLIDQIE